MEGNAQPKASLGDLILERMADAVVFADRAGLIKYWNPAAESVFGYSASETLGQGLDQIIPENLRAAHWRGFDAAMKSGVTKLAGRPTLTRAIHKSGRRLYVEMSFALVIDRNGEVIGSVAVARDITEKVKRDKAAARNGDGTTPSTQAVPRSGDARANSLPDPCRFSCSVSVGPLVTSEL